MIILELEMHMLMAERTLSGSTSGFLRLQYENEKVVLLLACTSGPH